MRKKCVYLNFSNFMRVCQENYTFYRSVTQSFFAYSKITRVLYSNFLKFSF